MREIRSSWLGFVFVALIVGLGAGCGGDPCEDAGDAICEKACECGGCAITDSTGSFTFSFDDEADCKAFYGLACDQDDGSVDFDACLDALDGAECMTVDGEGAVVSPDECSGE